MTHLDFTLSASVAFACLRHLKRRPPILICVVSLKSSIIALPAAWVEAVGEVSSQTMKAYFLHDNVKAAGSEQSTRYASYSSMGRHPNRRS